MAKFDVDKFNLGAGARVRHLRRMTQMTQQDLVKRMDDKGFDQFSQTQVTRVEQGRQPLKLIEAYALAEIFGVSMSSLLEGTEDLELAALEVQQQDALAAISERRTRIAGRRRVITRSQLEITQLEQEINYYEGVVHEMEQRIANINDGETDEDSSDADNGFTGDIS